MTGGRESSAQLFLEGAPNDHPSTSTVDVTRYSMPHNGNQLEKADEVAIGLEVPDTGSSQEHIVGKLSEHPNPSRLTPQLCTSPASCMC